MVISQQANSAPGMKSSVDVEWLGYKMRSEVENTLPSPEAKTPRKSRDRGRNTKKNQDTMNGHKPMKQVTSHTETNNGCVVTDAMRAESPTQTKQKDNMEVHQTETPESAQNKSADSETNRAANENTREDEKMKWEQHRVPGSSSEDKDNEKENTGEDEKMEGEHQIVPGSSSEDKDNET